MVLAVTALCAVVLAGGMTRPAAAVQQAGPGSYFLPIVGEYTFAGNGWRGKLTIQEARRGWASAIMRYDELGFDEHLQGTWQPSLRTLVLSRPLPWGNSQTYTLYLGDHDPAEPMFGGYFTQ